MQCEMEAREECAGGFKKVRETGREKQWGNKTKKKRVQLGRSGLGLRCVRKEKRRGNSKF